MTSESQDRAPSEEARAAMDAMLSGIADDMEAKFPVLQMAEDGRVAQAQPQEGSLPSTPQAASGPAPAGPAAPSALEQKMAMLEAQNLVLMQQMGRMQAPVEDPSRPTPQQIQEQRRGVLNQFQETYGVDPQDMREVVSLLVQEEIEPRIAAAQAEARIVERYPDSKDAAGALKMYLSTHPDVAQASLAQWNGGHHEAALEYAWLKYQQENPPAPVGPAQGAPVQDTVTPAAAYEELRQAAIRAQAPISRGSVQTVAQPPSPNGQKNQDLTVERLQQLHEQKKRGYDTSWLREVFSAGLPDDIFGPSS